MFIVDVCLLLSRFKRILGANSKEISTDWQIRVDKVASS